MELGAADFVGRVGRGGVNLVGKNKKLIIVDATIVEAEEEEGKGREG